MLKHLDGNDNHLLLCSLVFIRIYVQIHIKLLFINSI